MSNIEKALKKKKLYNILFVGSMAVVETGIFLLFFFNTIKGIMDGISLFNIVALDLILLWIGILVGYYAWAIYFFNINLGLPNAEWTRIEEEKKRIKELRELGVDTSNIQEPARPLENPYANQSMGLPGGTIRGTLALTLMIGGLSLFMFSMGNSQIFEGNNFIYDNFEFFKTAFLMMIAFYFGTHSLQILKGSNQGIIQKRFAQPGSSDLQKSDMVNKDDTEVSTTSPAPDMQEMTHVSGLKETTAPTVHNSSGLKVAFTSFKPPKPALNDTEISTTVIKEATSLLLTNDDIVKKAEENHIEPAALMAVVEVESGKSGFLDDGRPKILFEGHVFWRLLVQKQKEGKIDFGPEKYAAEHPDILYPKWTKQYYKGGSAEYDRLGKALLIEHDSALMSASWGKFQIMGENFKLAGYTTVDEFVEDHKISEAKHLDAFFNYCTNRIFRKKSLIEYLKMKNWQNFAEAYNGSGYAANQYDIKLEKSYNKHQKSLNQNISGQLKRETGYKSNKTEVLGELSVFDEQVFLYKCKTLELPWKNNQTSVSCIPEGTYDVVKRYSDKYKNHFHLLNVPDRSFILIHSGNYYTQTEGCILVGDNHTDINADGHSDVTNSRKTLAELYKFLPDKFSLTIGENA